MSVARKNEMCLIRTEKGLKKINLDIDKFLDDHDSFHNDGEGIIRGDYAEGSIGRDKIYSLLRQAFYAGASENIWNSLYTSNARPMVAVGKHQCNLLAFADKYRNQFLGETTKETQAKIDSGEYKLVNLN